LQDLEPRFQWFIRDLTDPTEVSRNPERECVFGVPLRAAAACNLPGELPFKLHVGGVCPN
jgi:hypothetical protein